MKKNVNYYFLRFIQELLYLLHKLCDASIIQNFNCIYYSNDDLFRLSSLDCNKTTRAISINRRFPAGKRISIITNANEIKVKVLYKKQAILPYMSVTGTSGIDIYMYKGEKYKWIKCISPESYIQMKISRIIKIQNNNHEIRIVFFLPPYAEISYIYISSNYGYKLYTYEEKTNKIVIYGSSITQGCAASRPGLSFANILCRECNVNVINYGLSESAKGQKYIIQCMLQEKPSCYIIEYDHNATVQELIDTHKNVYVYIRDSDSKSPIIFMSRFSGGISISKEEEEQRVKIIQDTINYAISKGDKKVFFLQGSNVSISQEDCFVDDRHPNDLGMYQIASQVKNILGKLGNEDE